MISTASVSSGAPAGPVGCRGACIVMLVVFVLLGAFIGAVWWGLRDLGL